MTTDGFGQRKNPDPTRYPSTRNELRRVLETAQKERNSRNVQMLRMMAEGSLSTLLDALDYAESAIEELRVVIDDDGEKAAAHLAKLREMAP